MNIRKQTYTVWIKDGQAYSRPIDGAVREVRETECYYGRIKDATGKWKWHKLYTDKAASLAKLADLIRQQERGEVGLVDPHKDTKHAPLTAVMAEWLADLKQQGRSDKYRRQQENQLNKIVKDTGISTVAQLTADALDRYLQSLSCSARSKNGYRQTCIALLNYLIRKKRLPPLNSLLATTRAIGEKKRRRRALPAAQLQNLINAARLRPLHEALRVRRGQNKGQLLSRLTPEYRAEVERIGRQRALLYLTALHTGLRAGELASLKVSDLHLDDGVPFWELDGVNTKNGKDAQAPLRQDLVEQLKSWIEETGKQPTDKVFDIPKFTQLSKLLRKDLKKACIPYQDEKGRYFDFHALRKCTGTYLRKAGIDPSVSKQWMRHSDIRLTMETYNDELMHDLAQCLDALPKLTME